MKTKVRNSENQGLNSYKIFVKFIEWQLLFLYLHVIIIVQPINVLIDSYIILKNYIKSKICVAIFELSNDKVNKLDTNWDFSFI